MNVVVTGAAGYIGTCLCKMLLEEYEDINIKAFDNFHYNQLDRDWETTFILFPFNYLLSYVEIFDVHTLQRHNFLSQPNNQLQRHLQSLF